VTASLFGDDASANVAFAEVLATQARGAWCLSLDLALKLAWRRLQTGASLDAEGDRVLIELVADLAVSCGQGEGADTILQALLLHSQEHRGGVACSFSGDCITVKRLMVALARDRLGEAWSRLADLKYRIGPLAESDLDLASLPAQEAACTWEAREVPDRALFFSRFYLARGLLSGASGRYEEASCLLERGACHAQAPASSLACRAWVALRLALAGVLLEWGQVSECGDVLTAVRKRMESEGFPDRFVRWHELTRRRHLLLGKYGPALHQLGRVAVACSGGGFLDAALFALLNQVHALLILNQVSIAEDLLKEASDLAERLGDCASLRRIAWLSWLARERARPGAEGVVIAPSVFEMHYAPEKVPHDARDRRGPPPLDLPEAGTFFDRFCEQALGVQCALSQGKPGLAAQRLRALRERFEACDAVLIHLRLHGLAGMVRYQEGAYEESDRLFSEICPFLGELGLKPDLWQALRGRAWCAARLNAPAEVQRELTFRTHQIQEELANSLSPGQRAIYLLTRWTVEESALRGEVDELLALRETVSAADQGEWKLWNR
jgi:hypothetical protein